MNAFLSDQVVSGYRPIPVDVGIALCPEHHGLVEWDRQTPAFDVLQAEAATARSILLQSTRQAELAVPDVAGQRVAGT